ncbi:hypothetical protein ScalyP_jg9944 [Parmales sp. scaly parma]|nr:hypothetical protein ScalyP_jg9944 [Parmales sp. scaly parma]
MIARSRVQSTLSSNIRNSLSLFNGNTINTPTCTPTFTPKNLTLTTRSVHSNRQKKKIFRYQYYEKKRQGLLPSQNQIPLEEILDSTPLLFPSVFSPTFLRNGWSAPPPSTFTLPSYPFEVRRTGNKKVGSRSPPITESIKALQQHIENTEEPASEVVEPLPADPVGFLPVYVRYRNNHSNVSTEVRRIFGDVDVLATELVKLCHPNSVVVTKNGGNIVVKGNHTKRIRTFLAELGF